MEAGSQARSREVRHSQDRSMARRSTNERNVLENPPVFAPQSTHCTDTVQHFQATSLPYQASNQHQAANQPSLSLARSVAQDNVRMSSSAPMRPNMPGSSPSPAAFNSYSNGRSNSQQPQMAFRFRVSKPEQQSNSVPSAGKRRHNGTDGGTDSRRRRSGSVEERSRPAAAEQATGPKTAAVGEREHVAHLNADLSADNDSPGAPPSSQAGRLVDRRAGPSSLAKSMWLAPPEEAGNRTAQEPPRQQSAQQSAQQSVGNGSISTGQVTNGPYPSIGNLVLQGASVQPTTIGVGGNGVMQGSVVQAQSQHGNVCIPAGGGVASVNAATYMTPMQQPNGQIVYMLCPAPTAIQAAPAVQYSQSSEPGTSNPVHYAASVNYPPSQQLRQGQGAVLSQGTPQPQGLMMIQGASEQYMCGVVPAQGASQPQQGIPVAQGVSWQLPQGVVMSQCASQQPAQGMALAHGALQQHAAVAACSNRPVMTGLPAGGPSIQQALPASSTNKPMYTMPQVAQDMTRSIVGYQAAAAPGSTGGYQIMMVYDGAAGNGVGIPVQAAMDTTVMPLVGQKGQADERSALTSAVTSDSHATSSAVAACWGPQNAVCVQPVSVASAGTCPGMQQSGGAQPVPGSSSTGSVCISGTSAMSSGKTTPSPNVAARDLPSGDCVYTLLKGKVVYQIYRNRRPDKNGDDCRWHELATAPGGCVSLAVVGRYLVCAGNGRLSFLVGMEKWVSPMKLASNCTAIAAVSHSSTAFIACCGEKILCRDCEDSDSGDQILWEYICDSAPFSSIIQVDQIIYGTHNGRIHMYNMAEEDPEWRSVDGQKRKIVSLAAGKNIYGVDENNRLYVCSRPKKGEEVDFSWNQSWKTSELFEEDCCVGVQPEYLADTPPTSLAQTRPSCEASSRAVASAPHRKSLRSHLMSAPTSDSTSGNNAAGSNGGCSAEGGRTGDTVSKQPLPTRLALSSSMQEEMRSGSNDHCLYVYTKTKHLWRMTTSNGDFELVGQLQILPQAMAFVDNMVYCVCDGKLYICQINDVESNGSGLSPLECKCDVPKLWTMTVHKGSLYGIGDDKLWKEDDSKLKSIGTSKSTAITSAKDSFFMADHDELYRTMPNASAKEILSSRVKVGSASQVWAMASAQSHLFSICGQVLYSSPVSADCTRQGWSRVCRLQNVAGLCSGPSNIPSTNIGEGVLHPCVTDSAQMVPDDTSSRNYLTPTTRS